MKRADKRGVGGRLWHSGRWRRIRVMLLTAGLLLSVAGEGAVPEGVFMNPSGAKHPSISHMKLDGDGGVWVVDHGRLYYLNYLKGEEFREVVVVRPAGAKVGSEADRRLSFGPYKQGSTPIGGGRRGVYATQQRQHGSGEIFRLMAGRAESVEMFQYETPHRPPRVYVSENGMIFNWGNRFLARLTADGWEQIEAGLRWTHTSVIDFGDDVFFYCNNKLYRVSETKMESMTPPPWHTSDDHEGRTYATRWGERGILLMMTGKPDLLAFDAWDGTEIPLPPINRTWQYFSNSITLPNGGTWLEASSSRYGSGQYLKLEEDGKLRRVMDSFRTDWYGIDNRREPQSILVRRDGDILLAQERNGIVHIRDGKVTFYGWDHGLAGGVVALAEDTSERVWAATAGGLIVFRLEEGVTTLARQIRNWEEYQLADRGRIWEYEPGKLAMFRSDQPRTLSRWDGFEWEHQEVPFDNKEVDGGMLDSRGHLLVVFRGFDRDECYEVTPEEVKHYKKVERYFTAALQAGVTGFSQLKRLTGAVVVPPGRVWYSDYYPREAVLVEEGRGDNMAGANVEFLVESEKYDGIVGGNIYGKFYHYENGVMKRIKLPREDPYPLEKITFVNESPKDRHGVGRSYDYEPSAMMLGEVGFTPYERAICDRKPMRFYPVMRYQMGDVLFFDVDSFEAARAGRAPEGKAVILPSDSSCLVPAASGGAWVWHREGIWRLLADRIFTIDTSGTPLAGERIRDISEDRAGNVWFELESNSIPGKTLLYKLSQVEVQIPDKPLESGRALEFEGRISATEHAEGVTPLWRIEGGEWAAGEQGKLHYEMRFPTSGTYRVEASGVVLGTPLKSAAVFDLNVSVELPRTRRTDGEDGKVAINDPFWEVPVETLTGGGGDLTLQWRVVDGEWQKSTTEGVCALVELEPGEHQLEFAAVEEEYWIDDRPVRIGVKYQPDYLALMASRIKLLRSSEHKVAIRAARELAQLRERVGPELDERIVNAEREMRLLPYLRHVLQRIAEEQLQAE